MRKPRSAHFSVFRDRADGWRWHLKSGNGRLIASSGESFTRRRDCLRSVAAVRRAVAAPLISEPEHP